MGIVRRALAAKLVAKMCGGWAVGLVSYITQISAYCDIRLTLCKSEAGLGEIGISDHGGIAQLGDSSTRKAHINDLT